ncbi:MAG: YceI family protein [Acetobacteraceae bacterium]|nr:YceI family protein [Rhodovarius sp.]MDW8397837.1 YceI family protein [Acetobacteraceae bacterium]
MIAIRVLAFALGLAIAAPALAQPVRHAIDPEHAWVTFRLSHLGFAQAIGTFHNVSGEIHFDPQNPAASRVVASIDARTVNTGLPARDEWIRAEAQLNTAAHPAITFRSTAIAVTGENRGRMEGMLSIRGVERPVVLDVTFNRAGINPINRLPTIGFSATGTIRRSEFGISAFLGPLGDEISVTIEIEANRPAS